MNEEKREENIGSPANEEACPKLEKKDLILSLAAILLCGCVLSGAIPTAWITLAIAALFAYTVIAVRNRGAVTQVLLACVIATVLTFMPVVGAVVLALILGTGTLSWLFMTLPKYKWAPAGVLALAYVLGCLVTANLISPLLAFAFVPAAALMAWAHARDVGRTSTVLHAFLGFVVAVLATLCVILWRAYGSLNYDVLMTFVNELKRLFVTVGVEAGKMLWETIEATAVPTAAQAESMEQLRRMYAELFSESNLQILADTLMGLAPAIVGIPTLIVSYLADVVLLRKYYNTEWRSRMTPAACALTISPAAGVIYFVCFLIAMFANGQSVFSMAVNNMYLLLVPGLCLIGVSAIIQNAKRAKGWIGVVYILFFVSMICCMGISSFSFVALWGAYVTISAALHQKIMEKLKDRDQQ